MKNVLCFVDWYSPGYRAGGISTAFSNFVSLLAKYYRFYIVTRNTDYACNIPYRGKKYNTWVELRPNEFVFYCTKKFIHMKNMPEIFKSINPDYIYINGVYSFWFSIYPLWHFRKTKLKVIVNPHGMLSAHAIAIKSFRKNFFILLANVLGLYKNIIFHAFSENEFAEVRNKIKKYSKIKIAPPILQRYNNVSNPERIKRIGELKLVSITRISPEKNILYALKILQKVGLRNENFRMEYHLYGPVYSEKYWQQCRKAIDIIPKNIKVYYHDSLDNAKIGNVLSKNHFMFLPSMGESFGYAIFESLLFGCPVIISDKTPWQDPLMVKKLFRVDRQMPLFPGWNLSLDKSAEFVRVIEECVMLEQEEYNCMSKRSFVYAQSIGDSPSILEANKSLFDD